MGILKEHFIYLHEIWQADLLYRYLDGLLTIKLCNLLNENEKFLISQERCEIEF